MPSDHVSDPAGWWQRAIAFSFDAALVNLAVWIPTLIVILLSVDLDTVATTNDWLERVIAALAISKLITLVAFWGVYMPLISARSGAANGQTLGKQIIGIKVIRSDRSPLTVSDCFYREGLWKGVVFLGLGCLLVVPFLLDILAPVRDQQARALHDRRAKTLVVKSR